MLIISLSRSCRFSNNYLVKRNSIISNLVDSSSRRPTQTLVKEPFRGVVGSASLIVKLNIVELYVITNLPMNFIVGVIWVFCSSHEVGGLRGMRYYPVRHPRPQHSVQCYHPCLSSACFKSRGILVINVNSVKVIGYSIVCYIISTLSSINTMKTLSSSKRTNN